MNQLQKYVNALFLAAAAIVWLVAAHYIVVLIGYFQLGRSLGGAAEVLQHALPLVLAVATFVILRANAAAVNFTTDSMQELTRVSWPGAKEVRVGTIVVIITVICAGIFFGIVDMAFTAVIKAILSV